MIDVTINMLENDQFYSIADYSKIYPHFHCPTNIDALGQKNLFIISFRFLRVQSVT